MRRFTALPLVSLLLAIGLQTATPSLPAAASGPHLDNNTGISSTAVAVSAALTGLLGFPVAVTGRVLTHPAIHNLYWDDNWDGHNPTAPTRAALDGFASALAPSHYFDPANQYGVFAGSYTGENQSSVFCGPRSPGAATSFFLILAWVTCEAGAVNPIPPIAGLPGITGVPAPDDNSLYVVYLPKGTTIFDFGLTSCANYGAYHFMSALVETSITPFGPVPVIQSFAFDVIPADCASSMDTMTQFVSHEVIEGATDPIFGLGWIDNSQFDVNHIVNIATKGEAADICVAAGAGNVRLTSGYSVERYWSNAGSVCQPMAPSTSMAVGQPSVSLNGTTYVSGNTFVNITGLPPAGRGGDTLQVSFRFWRLGTPQPALDTCPSNPCVLQLNANDGADGTYEVDFFTSDMSNGIRDELGKRFLTLDNTPPVSNLTIGAPQHQGAQLFVRNITNFTVTATDTGAGVGSISYRFFPQGAQPPSFSTVAGAGAIFQLSGPDGMYEVDTFATDLLGNAEGQHARFVSLDDTPPVVTIVQPAAATYVHSATLTLNYSVSDGAGSGVASVMATIDGSSTLGGQGFPSGRSINLLTQLALGSHTFSITAIDNVGNTRVTAVTFTIIVTAQSIKDDVHQFLAAGAIKNSGLADSLLAKLNAAANAEARGNCVAATNIYEAFIQELQAQTGKGITAQAAAIMIADAQYLINNCPGGRTQ